MPNTIDLLANEETTLDLTLQSALRLLHKQGVKTLTAGHIVYSNHDAPSGRILLEKVADRQLALRLLAEAKFKVSSARSALPNRSWKRLWSRGDIIGKGARPA